MTTNNEQHMQRLHEIACAAAKYANSSIKNDGRDFREFAKDMADAYIEAMSRLIAASERISISEVS